MKVQLLDNSMFDDGSLDCKNFFISTEDGCYIAEYPFIVILGMQDEVKSAIAAGKRYIAPNGPLVYGGNQILEIAWD